LRNDAQEAANTSTHENFADMIYAPFLKLLEYLREILNVKIYSVNFNAFGADEKL